MTHRIMVRNLTTLVDLRQREVDRLVADMAQKEAVRQRYRSNLDRLAGLCAGESAQGTSPSLSLNRAAYKQSVLEMIDQHRTELTLHEADMAVAQCALTAASHKRESLGQVLVRKERDAAAEQAQRDQKQQDELASQVWWRGRR
jgi:flagellar export protein FliJ